MVSSRFIISASSTRDFPATGFAEIALVGRSNVGKSSLINALVKQTIARTSAAPGKTRLANYYEIGSGLRAPGSGSFYLVDLPGYGYARGGEESVRAFEQITAEYFTVARGSPRRIAGILHLIDARHPELDTDLTAHRWLLTTDLPVAVVATKIDKLSQSDRGANLKALEEQYDSAILPASSLKRTGLDAVWKMVREWLR